MNSGNRGGGDTQRSVDRWLRLQVGPEEMPHPRWQVEGDVTASTAPSPRPTRNPNPNTGEAAQPNNAAPGFPFGDN